MGPFSFLNSQCVCEGHYLKIPSQQITSVYSHDSLKLSDGVRFSAEWSHFCYRACSVWGRRHVLARTGHALQLCGVQKCELLCVGVTRRFWLSLLGEKFAYLSLFGFKVEVSGDAMRPRQVREVTNGGWGGRSGEYQM